MGKALNGKELGENISQRKDGRYDARYVDRFGNRKTLYNKDLRELKKMLSEAIYENSRQINIADTRITLDSWFEKWMQVYKLPMIRPSTKLIYEEVYHKLISPEIGRVYISELTQMDIKRLINHVNDKGYQWETQNKIRVMLTDMFNRAMEDNFVVRNPAKGVRLSKNKPNTRYILTREDQAAFFECSSGTFYDNLFVVAVNTGLRPGELYALTWDDIDLKSMTINVDKTLLYQNLDGDNKKEFHLGPPKTKQSVRKVPINKQCEVALKKQFGLKKVIELDRRSRKHEFSDRLFITRFNTPLNSVIYCDAIKKIVDEINLQRDISEHIEHFGGHTFRHTFATRCIESGVQPKTLQKYLGHATLQMTMDLYVHITDDFKNEEMLKFESGMAQVGITPEDIERRYERAKNVINFDGVKMA